LGEGWIWDFEYGSGAMDLDIDEYLTEAEVEPPIPDV
jgi:hypothetical protein